MLAVSPFAPPTVPALSQSLVGPNLLAGLLLVGPTLLVGPLLAGPTPLVLGGRLTPVVRLPDSSVGRFPVSSPSTGAALVPRGELAGPGVALSQVARVLGLVTASTVLRFRLLGDEPPRRGVASLAARPPRPGRFAATLRPRHIVGPPGLRSAM